MTRQIQFLALLLSMGQGALHAAPPFPSSEIKAIREVRLDDDRDPVLPAIGRERLQAFRDSFQAWVLGFLETSGANQDLVDRIQKAFEAGIKEVDRTTPPPQSTESPSKYSFFNGEVAGQFFAPPGHKDLILFRGTVEDHCGQDGLVYVFFKKGEGSWAAWSAYPNPPHEVVEGMGELPEVCVGPPDNKGHFLLVTGHYVPWFQSTWRVVRLDSWILARREENLILLEKHRSEHGIWIDPDPPFKLKLESPNIFTLRYRDGSMDPGRNNTGRTLRFRFDESGYQRIPPYGDTPEDFLEEWFRLPWNVATSLAAKHLLPKLKPMWEAFQANKAYPTFHETTNRADQEAYSSRCPEGWRVDFDGWGPEGDGPSMSFILSRGKAGFFISGFKQEGH